MQPPSTETVADAVVRVTVAAPPGSPHTKVVVAKLTPDGGSRDLASWSAEGPEHAAVVVSRSPDRTALAVVVDDAVSVVDLRNGTVTGPTSAGPPAGGRARSGWESCDATPEVSWSGPDGGPEVVRPGLREPVRFALEPGWDLELTGGAIVDGGHSGDGGTSPGWLLFDDGTTAEERAAAYARLRADEAEVAHRPDPVACASVRGGVRTLVHEEARRPLDGVTRIHWPPVVGPAGALLRRSVGTAILPPDEQAGTSTTMQHPWLLARSGAVRTIPTPLGVSPLCELPGGGFLLRGTDALWLDGRDEPLHVLGLDGRLTAFRPRGSACSATVLLGEVAPELVPAEPPEIPEDARWGVDAARVDESRGALVLFLTEDGWGPDHPWDESSRAVVVALPLDGAGDVRLLARAERRAGRLVAFAL